jgi:putative ABC transport system substrate-binding protein
LAIFDQNSGMTGPRAVNQSAWFQRNPLGKYLARHGWSEQNLDVQRWNVPSLREDVVEAMAKRIVQGRPDVILAEFADLAQALRAHTKTIPIVAAVDDAVAFGIAKAGLRSGTNVTGWVSGPVTALARQLPLLRELVPRLTAVHLVAQESARRRLLERKISESGLTTRMWRDHETFEKGMEGVRPDPEAALWIDDLDQDDARLAELARKLRMPSTGANEAIARLAGLFYYNVAFRGHFWDIAAPFVERVLRGEDPGAIVLEKPAVTQFVVNLETARAIDIAIPKTWLTRATHVIEASKAESLAAGKGPKRIIWSRVGDPDMNRIREAFRSRGFVEGRDIALAFRDFGPERDEKRIDELADSLVRSKPDIIVVWAHMLLWSLKKRTRDIPVIFYNLAMGGATESLVASRARPGANLTGHTISAGGASFTAKQFNVFKDLVPSMKRLAVVEDRQVFEETARRAPGLADEYMKALHAAGAQVGIEIVVLKVPSEADEAARAVLKSGAQFVSLSAYVAPEVERRILSTPIPVACFTFGKVQRGCLCGVDIDWTEGETYVIQVVERILRGESPAVIPVYEGTRLSFALNRRRARELGIDVPASVLLQMTEVYE